MSTVHLLVLEYDLHLHGCQSLKDKRSVLKRLKHLLRANHNVSLAESEYQDKWQRTRLVLAGLATDRAALESLARSVREEIDGYMGVEVLEETEDWL